MTIQQVEAAPGPHFDDTVGPFQRYLRATGGARGKVNSEVTIRNYTEQLKLFWAFCAGFETTPYEASAGLCERWFERRKRRGISSTARTKDLAALRHFYAWLARQGLRDDDPAADLRIKREQSVPTRPLSEDELLRLVAACHNERDRLLLLLLHATSIRIGELAAMNAEDVSWHDGALVIHGKGSKERLVCLPAPLLERLHTLVGLVGADGQAVRSGAIWRSLRRDRPLPKHQLYKVLKAIGGRAGVDLRPHRLRATFAVNFLREYHDVHELMRLMGHASLNTTAQYLKWVTDEPALAHQRDLALSRRLSSAAWSVVAERPARRGLLARLFRFAAVA